MQESVVTAIIIYEMSDESDDYISYLCSAKRESRFLNANSRCRIGIIYLFIAACPVSCQTYGVIDELNKVRDTCHAPTLTPGSNTLPIPSF